MSACPKRCSTTILRNTKLSSVMDDAAHLKIPASFNITDYFLYVPALAHPGRPAILGEPAPVSYGELASLTRRVSMALSREGIALCGTRLDRSSGLSRIYRGIHGSRRNRRSGRARKSDGAGIRLLSLPARLTGTHLAIVHEFALPEFIPAAKGFRASFDSCRGRKSAPCEKAPRPRVVYAGKNGCPLAQNIKPRATLSLRIPRFSCTPRAVAAPQSRRSPA